jgi:RNA-directed DNA polymerase
MTREQEESDDSVVPQGRRKPTATASVKRGGKGVTASKEVGQLGLFRGTADSPQGVVERRGTGQPVPRPRSMPKPRTTRRRSPPAMTMEAIADELNLKSAFEKVASNRGAPGPDRQSVEQVRRHLTKLLPALHTALLDGSFRPGMIRRVWIPKPGGGERGLGIPNVIDRIVQQAVYEVLSPHFEPIFHASSHGFRPGRSCQTAIAEAKGYVTEGREWVVDLDLEKFFDRVNHARLLARLQQKGVLDARVLQLIRRMLEAKVVMPDGVVVSTEEGTPQGGPLSPLLSNVVLDELDWELARRGHRFVRYADDCNIYVRSERAGQRVMASISRFLTKRLRLTVNTAKSAVARPGARHFVGFSLQRTGKGEVQTRLSQRSLRRIRRRVVELTPRNWGGSLEACVTRINEYFTGWIAFFYPVDRATLYDLDQIDAHVRRRLRAIVFRQKKRRRHIVNWLQFRRVPALQARADVYGRHRSLWALSITPSAHKAMSNYWFGKQGLVPLARLWRRWNARPPEVLAPTQLELTLG